MYVELKTRMCRKAHMETGRQVLGICFSFYHMVSRD